MLLVMMVFIQVFILHEKRNGSLMWMLQVHVLKHLVRAGF